MKARSPKPERARKAQPPAQLERRRLDPPVITVRFAPGQRPVLGSGAAAGTATCSAEGWAVLDGIFPDLQLIPQYDAAARRKLQKLVARARRLTPDYRPARFSDTYHVRLPPQALWKAGAPKNREEPAAELRALLERHLPIDRVTVEQWLAPLPAVISDDGGAHSMGHLEPAPKGVGVEKAWLLPGGQGQGQVLAHVERGWHLAHAEFAGLTCTLLPGGLQENSAAAVMHGTNALGVAVARQNGKYGIGVAPLAAEALLASELRVTAAGDATAAAIVEAVTESVSRQAGGVLLIELQKELHDFDASLPGNVCGPCEVAIDVFEAIQLAVANHVVVIEAAGNGGAKATPPTGLHLDDVTGLLHGDSGAILVGQSWWKAGTGHVAVDFGITGTAIDCFAWGDSVYAASVSSLGRNRSTGQHVYQDEYTSSFGGTSSASAIIAGVALVVQGLARKRVNAPWYLPPLQMRALLGDPDLNTHLADGTADHVGVMPDLEKIAEELGLLPDLYIRDHVGDTGGVHDGLVQNASPDIIVRTLPLTAASPQAAFGAGSGTEDRDDLSEPVTPGSSPDIYVRVRNRGQRGVLGATVTVYLSGPSPSAQPWQWQALGTASVDVPAGNALVVAGPIKVANVPGPGPWCLVATVDHAEDRVFPRSSFRDPADYATYLRVENNVATRNFDEVLVPVAHAVASMAADVAGPPAGASDIVELSVDGQLPAGAVLELELPETLARCMSLPEGAFTLDKATKTRRGRVPACGRTRLGFARLKRRDVHRVLLHVRLPEEARGLPGRVSLVQSRAGRQVGRAIWRLKPAPPLPAAPAPAP